MSAIWGAIALDDRQLPKEVTQMESCFSNCVIDRYERQQTETVYMGCGIQYFTPEAKKEQLPIFQKQEGIYFDADVVLDNREELYHRLGLTKEQGAMLPDGELLFQMYRKYGAHCLNEILGVFSMVYYDAKKQRIEIATDVTGDRCLYYRIKDGIFYYATLIEPLKLQKAEVNGRWIADFLGMDFLYMIDEAEETPMMDIYRIAPAQCIRITKNRIQKKTYWHPFKHFRELELKNDGEYKKQFVHLWKKAVIGMLRSNDEISILLSGGMDSTSVACVAAPYLKKQGRVLHSYTSVPIKEFEAPESDYDVPDEREDVLKTKKYLKNLDCTFLDMPHSNPWTDRISEMRDLEMPYKSVENLLWISEAMRQAYQRNSRIMLTGEYGNSSISYSDFEIYMNTLFRKRKFLSLLRELTTFQKRYKFSRKYALKQILKEGLNKTEKSELHSACGKSFINENFKQSQGVEQRLCMMYDRIAEGTKDFSRFRKMMIDKKAFRQIGEICTKHSLATGTIMRDPTRDKRILEFCIHLPVTQFIKEGEDRRLVRIYLKEFLPEHIMVYNKKGKQSADLKTRMEKKWSNTRQEWMQIYQEHRESIYVDVGRAISDLTEHETIEGYSAFDLTRHMYTLMVLEYCDQFEK